MADRKSHKHRFTVSGWCGSVVYFQCRCGDVREREMDREELSKFAVENNWHPKPADDIHSVMRAFNRQFLKPDGSWKFDGYNLMQRVERWVKRYKGDARIVSCDDDSFMCSDLVLIEHRTADSYMGTTVIFLHQDGSPAHFFLYPDHRKALLKALLQIEREAAPRERREREAERRRSLWWDSRRKPCAALKKVTKAAR